MKLITSDGKTIITCKINKTIKFRTIMYDLIMEYFKFEYNIKIEAKIRYITKLTEVFHLNGLQVE